MVTNKTVKCPICGKKLIPGGPESSHYKKHVRDGSMRVEDGEFIITGEKPQKYKTEAQKRREKQKETQVFKSHFKPMDCDSRTKNKAKYTKKKIKIRCRKCGEWGDARPFADERFLTLYHCDTISLFPVRLEAELMGNPNKVIED